MSQAIDEIIVKWQEDGSADCLARVCAADATGPATGVRGEGYLVKQADLSSITCSVFNRTPGYATPDTPITTPTVTIATSVYDTLQSPGPLWDADEIGFNFKHRLSASNFPGGGQTYVAEYKYTLSSGEVGFVKFRGVTSTTHGS